MKVLASLFVLLFMIVFTCLIIPTISFIHGITISDIMAISLYIMVLMVGVLEGRILFACIDD